MTKENKGKRKKKENYKAVLGFPPLWVKSPQVVDVVGVAELVPLFVF
jgi:hypothetical protein